MIRCPLCGLRLRNYSLARPSARVDEAPRCPTHGAAPTVAPCVDAEPAWDPFQHASAFLAQGYRLTKLLGRGGFGVVVAAVRQRDQLELALKITYPEQPLGVAQLAREGAFLARVGPPHAPALYESGTLLDRPYLAIEVLRGETLADALVAAEGPIPLARFGTLADAILTALAAVHSHGIAHRDLKPENVFLREDASGVHATLIDFGLANDASTRADSTADTVPVTDDDAIGTAEYMSPEQCDGLADTDPRSDIYSVGALFFELITGAPPFWGKSADVREAQRSRRPALLSAKVSCPPSLDQVIRRCLSKDRALRYDDVESLRAALAIALSEAAPAATVKVAIAAVTPPREKRTMGLVFFESQSGLQAVQALVTSSGGQIVQTTGAQYVAAFGHDVGDNPVRSAFAAAQRLALTKLTQRALVDVAQVSVQQRPDGTKRMFAAVFAKKDRIPAASDPTGIQFTGPATEVMPDLTVFPVLDRADRFLVSAAAPRGDATIYGAQHTLVGQEQRLGTLRESALAALTRSEPTLVSVIAGAGYGKTHVARALEQVLERVVADIELIRLAAQEGMVGAGSQLAPELLRRALRLGSEAPEDPEAVLRLRYGELGDQHWVGAAFALGWIDSDHPAVRKLAAAPGALRLAAARATGEALRLRSQQVPLAVVIDDAHQADDAALDALEYATLREAKARIWVCVLARPSFTGARPNWGTRAAHAQQVVLEALSPQEAADLARRLLHPVEQVPPIVLAKLAERTQGVPRLLVELVRGLKRDGLIRRNERGTGFYLATEELDKLPDLPIVQWNATREVEALPAQLAAHARLSSVLGNGFSAGELETFLEVLEQQDTLDEAQLDASVGIARLVEAGMLVRHRTGLLDFRHSLLRDTIYQQLPEAQLKRLHRAAYELYLRHAMSNEQRLPRLALHAARSGQAEVAAAHYLELAERARAAHAYFDAEAAYGHALQNLAEADLQRVGVTSRGRALMRSRLGRQEEAQRDLKRARECADSLGERELVRDLLLDEAIVLDWLRDFPASAALVRSAAEQVGDQVSPLTRVRIAVGLARTYHRAGDSENCIRLGAEAIAGAAELGDEGYEPRVISLLMMGPDSANLGRFEDAERYFASALSEAKARADLLHVGGVYVNRSILWYLSKNVAKLFDDLNEASRVARELGDGSLEYLALNNAAETAFAIADLERAQASSERALQVARSMWGESARDTLTTVLLLARTALYRNERQQARALLDQLRTLARERTAKDGEEETSATELALAEMVELALRDAGESEWDALEARAASTDVQAAERIEIIECRAAEARRAGRDGESRRAFQRALELNRESPSLIGDRVQQHLARAYPASC